MVFDDRNSRSKRKIYLLHVSFFLLYQVCSFELETPDLLMGTRLAQSLAQVPE
jgi:hypothetical protein